MPTSICPAPQLLQHRPGLILVQPQLEPWQRLVNFARHARQKIRPDRGQQRQAQLPRQRVSMRARERHHFVARFEDAPRARDDLFARFGERDLLRLALDELHARDNPPAS